jgi:serine protease Do
MIMDEYRYGSDYTPSKPKKSRGWLLIIAVALCFSLLGSAMGAGLVLLLNPNGNDGLVSDDGTKATKGGGSSTTILEGEREQTVIDINKIDTSKLLSAAEVYAANVNSTVGITTSITTNYWGVQSTSAASGSGFIISQDGYVLTNHHVIEDSDSITVTMYSGEDYEAELIGYDESNDIAVLKIEAEDLAPVVLGDSDNLNVGDSVIAIGNPLGELTFSLTAGKISAKDREVTFSNGVMMNLLQTDCAINSGNSGGALFNLYGEVIGVTNAKYSGSTQGSASIDNIGFAIPLNSIRGIIDSIIEKGYVSKPYIGVSVTDTPQEYQFYGLPQGATVRNVAPDSPAQKADLQPGDIITKVDTQPITGSRELIRCLKNSTVGQELKLTLYRKGQTLEVTITVGEQKTSANQEMP